jgi:sodium transport system permease protein
MSWKNIKLIFLREVRDQLRDRRTLFMIAILPLLMYPALGIGLVQMLVLFSEQPRNVVVLGDEHLPPPPLIEGDRFALPWFRFPETADKLRVITEQQVAAEADGGSQLDAQDLRMVEQARRIREKLDVLGELEDRLEAAQQADDRQQITRLEQEIAQLKAEVSLVFSESRIQVLIVIPDGLADHIAQVNRDLAQREVDVADQVGYRRPKIVQNRADERSAVAFERVRSLMENWEAEILKQRLADARLPATLSTPINLDSVDLAQQEQLSANVWSKLFPALLVIMAVTGAFYPAVDLAAGEKERGTMETLLICPATRTEIVMGKFFTVMLFSMSTVLLNLLSMGLTGKYMVSIAGSGSMFQGGEIPNPSLGAIGWIIVLLIPLSALFSALCLALATFARSTKEGQYYLTPLLVVSLGLTVFCLSPLVEIEPFNSIIPVMGIALLLKSVLNPMNANEHLLYAIPVLVTSIGYSLVALWWAIDQFRREDVLFRESERFEIRLWIRHLLRDKEPLPSFTEAAFCFVMIMLLQFATLKLLNQQVGSAIAAGQNALLLRLLMMQQLVMIATPALLMAAMLTTSLRRTLRLYLPSRSMLAAAVVLPLALHPLSVELLASLEWFFPALPQGLDKVLLAMNDPNLPWWLIVLTFAITPALCEEVAFRGFILSGFGHSGRTWLAIGLSSLAFGLMHMVPQQVFNAALLGLVLGLIAVRSNSLLPCIVFHAIYNGVQVLRSRIDAGPLTEGPLQWFVFLENESLRYSWPTLIVAAAIAVVLIRWLVNQPNAGSTTVTRQQPKSDHFPPAREVASTASK